MSERLFCVNDVFERFASLPYSQVLILLTLFYLFCNVNYLDGLPSNIICDIHQDADV